MEPLGALWAQTNQLRNGLPGPWRAATNSGCAAALWLIT